LLFNPLNTNFFIKILSSSLNTTLVVDKRCSDVCRDEFSVPQTDCKSKQIKEQSHGKFDMQSAQGKTRYFKHRKYENWWMNNKAKDELFAFSSISAENLNF